MNLWFARGSMQGGGGKQVSSLPIMASNRIIVSEIRGPPMPMQMSNNNSSGFMSSIFGGGL